ncbi:hypothetical protein ERJ75_001055000 [Trypanosoma vivax]|uniref:Uncharacterized protein n=1 Tax=Trypanosoma vivax (strain Y486) TaxID=1055687 RepID=G0U0E4_TRYVY|nr:hypothetical protein TRVL_04186 [Trypanosoma vivax]KAH8610767.1 hypothetical protein ERJ75_001055000 [Trypanosoma vivax]CCC49542.1 conserved hypothetical protein [Trypanosoma vivax Y486]
MFVSRCSFLRLTTALGTSFRDVRAKELFERRRREMERSRPLEGGGGECSHDLGVETSSSTDERETSNDGEERKKMLELLREQGRRRVARREAFLQWQAGQREKGAAQRLVRQAKTQEKFKRHHYHTQSGRLVSVGLAHGDGTSTNTVDSPRPATDMSVHRRYSADFAVPLKERSGPGKLHIVLQKR